MLASEMHMLNPTTNLQGKYTGIKDQSVLAGHKRCSEQATMLQNGQRGLLVAGLEEIVLNP